MPTNDQQHLFDALALQQKHQRIVNRALYIVLPLLAFMLAVMLCYISVLSLVLNFVVIFASLYAVSIRRQNWRWWLMVLSVFCLSEHYFMFGDFNQYSEQLLERFLTMSAFTLIFAIGRPYLDTWLMKSDPQNPDRLG